MAIFFPAGKTMMYLKATPEMICWQVVTAETSSWAVRATMCFMETQR